MNNKLLFIIFAGYFIFSYCQSEEQLKLDTETSKKTLKNGQTASYFITLPNEIQENTNFLIFDVFAAENDGSDPDIYISDVRLIL